MISHTLILHHFFQSVRISIGNRHRAILTAAAVSFADMGIKAQILASFVFVVAHIALEANESGLQLQPTLRQFLGVVLVWPDSC